MSRIVIGLLALFMASGCGLDPGVPDYSAHVGLREVEEEVEFLAGPTPFDPNRPRLALGLFYEGGKTAEIAINDVDTHFYIFEDSFAVEPSTERVEGTMSDLLTLKGGSFYGGGIIYDVARDLSDWTTLHIALRSSDETFADVPVGFLSGEPAAAVESNVLASSYGYVNDGAWHALSIPLDDVPGFDRTRTVSPLVLVAPGNIAGEQLFVDDVYCTQE